MIAQITAVHDEQLESVLRKLGVLDSIVKGKIKCKFSGETITIENLHSYFPESGEIKFVSDNPEAIKKLSIYLSEKQL